MYIWGHLEVKIEIWKKTYVRTFKKAFSLTLTLGQQFFTGGANPELLLYLHMVHNCDGSHHHPTTSRNRRRSCLCGRPTSEWWRYSTADNDGDALRPPLPLLTEGGVNTKEHWPKKFAVVLAFSMVSLCINTIRFKARMNIKVGMCKYMR